MIRIIVEALNQLSFVLYLSAILRVARFVFLDIGFVHVFAFVHISSYFPGAYCRQNNIYYHVDVTTNESAINKNGTCSIYPKTVVVVTNVTENSKNEIKKLALHVSSEKDVKTLLDYVNWELFIYICEKSICNYAINQQHRFQHLCSANASCCWSSSYEAVVSPARRCVNSNCTDFLQTSALSRWYIFFVFGILCLCGNFVVIYQKIIEIWKNQKQPKNIMIYNILVLNLSVANLLMGIYLIAVSLEIRYKLENDIYFSNHSFCNTFGVISTVSTQTSISILAIISFYRLVSLRFPYKNQHVKVVVGIVVSTWLMWLVIALLPTIPLEPLVTILTFGISKNRKILSGTLNTFEITIPLIKDLKSLFSSKQYEEINLVLEEVCKYPTRLVLSKIHDRFGWINLDIDNWFYVGHYNLNYICTTNLFVDGTYFNEFDYFGLTFAFINLAISIVIITAYVFITFVVSDNKKIACILCRLCKSKQENCQHSFRTQLNQARNAENQRIFKRISIIIITNMFFVTPLCLAALVEWLIPLNETGNDVLKALIDVQTVLLFVVPLNSIINPYIYSFAFWRNCFKKLKDKVCKLSA